MAKSVHGDVLDAALGVVRGATRMVALPSAPADYAGALSARLAEAAMGTSDFTLAAGDVSGRKLSVTAKAALPVIAGGTATHVALLDGARVLYVTTCPAQGVSLGGAVNIGAWDVEIAAPV